MIKVGGLPGGTLFGCFRADGASVSCMGEFRGIPWGVLLGSILPNGLDCPSGVAERPRGIFGVPEWARGVPELQTLRMPAIPIIIANATVLVVPECEDLSQTCYMWG